MLAKHVRINGRVQGVFFRAWTREQAQALGVTGWVRNCPDGRVEAHVEGEDSAIEQMIERLRRGPPSANVEDLRTWDVEPCEFDGFEVRHCFMFHAKARRREKEQKNSARRDAEASVKFGRQH